MLLGGKVNIPTGPFRMAAMMKRPVIFIVGLYRGGNRYEVRYEELYDFSVLSDQANPARPASVGAAIDAAIALYVARLERLCLEAPYNWFNFYDFWADSTHAGKHQSGKHIQRLD